MTIEADELLRRASVRIEAARGNGASDVLGTGFFVLPGVILTCAHVVARTPSHQLTVRCFGDRAVDPIVVAASVEAARPPSDGGATIWPLPDVALLRVDGAGETSVARIAAATPTLATKVFVFGFPRSSYGEPRLLDSLSHSYFEGAPAYPLIGLAGDALPSGFSGAPVLDLGSGNVCGIVKTRRGEPDGSGGWMLPFTWLLDTIDRHDLFQANRRYHQATAQWSAEVSKVRILAMASRPGELAEMIATAFPVVDLRRVVRLTRKFRGIPRSQSMAGLGEDAIASQSNDPVPGPRVIRVEGTHPQMRLLTLQAVHEVAATYDATLLLHGAESGSRTSTHDLLGTALQAAGVADVDIPLGTNERVSSWQILASTRRLLVVLLDGSADQVEALLRGGSTLTLLAVRCEVGRELRRVGELVRVNAARVRRSQPENQSTKATHSMELDGAETPGPVDLLGQLPLVGIPASLAQRLELEAPTLWKSPLFPVLARVADVFVSHPDARSTTRSRVDPLDMHRLDAWLDDIFGHPVDVRRHAHLIVRLVEWRARESGDPGEIAGRAAEALRTTGAVVAAARLNRLRTTSTNASRARRGYADLGHLLGRQRELDEAERLLQAALHLASDAPLDRAMVLRRLAVIRHKQGHYEDAATLLMEARRLLDTRKSTGFDRAARERSRVNREAATVARRSDRIDEAVAILLESDRQLQALPSSRNVLAERARVARQLGRCSLRLDDVVAARARYAEASSLALRTDEFQVQALVTRDSTEVNIRLGLFEEALSTSATAHQLAVERNEPAGVGDGLEARGRASFAVGDLHAAESFFDQALEQYRSIAGHDGESGARIGLAEVAAARGLTEFARSLLPRVVDGINGIADYRTLRVHLRLSDRDHEAATRIAAVAEERSLPSIRAAALGAAAVSIATSDTTRAESYLEPAFAIAGSHPSFETEILLHGCATRVLLAKGQVVPAAGQAEAARLMIASVTRPMSAENAIKLEAKYRPILALADALEFLPGTDALERRWTGYFG